MQSFECPDLPDFHLGIVRKPWSIHQGDTVVQLPQCTPFDITVNRQPQSPTDSLINSVQDCFTDRDQILQSLDSSRTDSSDNSLDISLPELQIKMGPVQIMTQLLPQLTTKPSTETHCTPFTGTPFTSLGNYRSFWTTDGLVICCRCNHVGDFARACQGNLPPPRAPTPYQNHWHNYVPPGHYQHPQLLYTPNHPSNQYSQHPS